MDPYDYHLAYSMPSAVPAYGYYYLVEAQVPVPKPAKRSRDLSVQELLFGCFRAPSYVYEDAISETNPRVIDDARARKLAADLKKCTYYETCATYGLNVEKVFQDACQKIVQQRMMTLGTIPRSATPNHFATARSAIWGPAGHPQPTLVPPQQGPYLSSPTHGGHPPPGMMMSPHPGTPYGPPAPQGAPQYHGGMPPPSGPFPSFLKEKSGGKSLHPGDQMLSRAASSGPGAMFGGAGGPRYPGALHHHNHYQQQQQNLSGGENSSSGERSASKSNNHVVDDRRMMPPPSSADGRDQFPTPSSTPTTSRKSRRRSNLFTPSSKKEDAEKKAKNGGELGVGRAIPLKQGLLYKRSSKTLNKEWKKKYVTLCDDGRLTYHPSLQDYMEDVHGKEIDLQCTTVKYAGQHRPRVPATNGMLDMSQLSLSDRTHCDTDNSIVISANGVANGGNSSVDPVQQQQQQQALTPVGLMGPPPQPITAPGGGPGVVTTPAGPPPGSAQKKRYRRLKTSISRSKHNHHNHDDGDDSDGYEFFIVSKDSKTWHFEASNAEERDEWVQAIEQCILASLQGNESFKGKSAAASGGSKVNLDPSAIMALRKAVEGNQNCCDCDAPNPDWASLNLGSLICIECSGVHRNLGSHISRVRSLGLDEWPPGPLAVMMALGNRVANSVWEGGLLNKQARAGGAPSVKPGPTTVREEKERWIRWKYEEKRFLAPLSNPGAIGQHLIDAVCRGDVKHVSLLLAHAKPEHVTVTVSSRDLRTPLHIACSMGNLPIVQLLLWNQAPVMPRDHDGMTCLDHARMSGNSNVEELIIQYCSTNAAPPPPSTNAAASSSSSSSTSSGPQHSPSAPSLLVSMNNGGSSVNNSPSSAVSTPIGAGLRNAGFSITSMGRSAVGPVPGGSLVMRCQDGSKGPNGLDPFEKMPSSVI